VIVPISFKHAGPPLVSVQHLSAFYGETRAVKDVSFDVHSGRVVALIGPSGCGKSTLLRCLNRMHEEAAQGHVEGSIRLEGRDIYASGSDPVEVRAKIGMVFQKPNPFPSLSIMENAAAGLFLRGVRNRKRLLEVAERSLKQAALWDEVKDKLNAPGLSLSGGQQQRLCIARALAVSPPVILMDEPTSALDPLSTIRIEELVMDLKKSVTIVVVTHNLQQAARISDDTGFMYFGELVEFGLTRDLFTTPKDHRTENYVTGRSG
jgi:phosphate transport system ATP-binding protein